jgi:ketopantoate reductase
MRVLATIKPPGVCITLWDTAAVAHTIKPILQPQTAFTSFQNGVEARRFS